MGFIAGISYNSGYEGVIAHLATLTKMDVTHMASKTISLTRDFVTVVDEEDYKCLMQWSWCITSTNDGHYAVGKVNGKIILMHRYIIKAPKNMEVDHINNNRLDNRKSNLRLCNRIENARNCKFREGFTSKYKGVSWHKKANKWIANITINYKQIYLGLYDSELKAAQVYDDAAKKYFGSFSKTNEKFYAN